MPKFLGPLLGGAFIGGALGLSADVSRQVTEALIFASLLVWWRVLAAPRPYSKRTMMGGPLHLTGCGHALVGFLGVYCLSWIDLLAGHGRDLLRAASSGGAFSIRLTGPDPANVVALLMAIGAAPVIEELVFRAKSLDQGSPPFAQQDPVRRRRGHRPLGRAAGGLDP